MQKQVVVSGMGIICGIGNNKAEVMERIKTCESGIRQIEKFDVSMYDSKFGSEVKNYDESQYFDRNILKHVNLCSQFGLISIREALAQSKLDLLNVDPYEVGICVGSSHGALDVIHDFYRKIHAGNFQSFDEAYLFRKLHASILKVIAHQFQINGVMSMVSTACASGNNAMGMALDWVRTGKANYVIVGGSDVLDQSLHAGFSALKAVSPQSCSPFSGIPGITLGEGAAFFIVENCETAIKREAPVLAEILGYGLSGDAYHATSPDPKGIGVQLAMDRALKDSGISKEDVEYVNAHGTGTDGNDSMESNAHMSFFGDIASKVPTSSTKSFFGHATGAAGSLETCVSILCMNEGILPPTLNFTESRYKHPIDYIPNEIRQKQISVMMCNNYGFAGNNSVTVLKRFQKQSPPIKTGQRKRRVGITGIGLVSPIAIGFEAFGKALKEKTHAINKTNRFDTKETNGEHGCFIENFKPSRFNKQINADRRMDLVSQFSTAAASLCLDDAGIPKKRKVRKDIGIVMCVSSAPKQGIHEHLTKMITKGPQYPSSIFFPYSTQNSALGHVSITLGLMGATSNLHVDGCSSLNGIIYGQSMVESGRQDKLIVGGGDEVFWSYFEELSLLRELNNDQNPIVPFGKDSFGYHPGEGAAFMMLEPVDEAETNDRKVYAELVGSGMTIDSNQDMHCNDSSGKGLIKAIEMALNEAGINARQIGWISGTERGLVNINKAETKAINHYWSSQLEDISIVNTIPLIGWMDSVSPVMNLAAMIYSAQNGDLVPCYDVSKEESFFSTSLGNKRPALDREYGLCLGIAREGFNYALIIKPRLNSQVVAFNT